MQGYMRDMTGYVSGIELDGRKLAGQRLWTNRHSEANLAVQDMDVMGLRADNGAFNMRQRLESVSDTMMKSVPRPYEKLFDNTKFRGGDLNALIIELLIARDDLEKADPASLAHFQCNFGVPVFAKQRTF